MPESTPSAIGIAAPFNQAIELTKRILFRPFNFKKWCVMGFAAFLARFLGGGGGGGGYNSRNPAATKKAASFESMRQDAVRYLHEHPWIIPATIAAVIVGLIISVVFLWLSARGRFMFIDCVVRNRGAIREPWSEFRREGNSYFRFDLLLKIFPLLLFALGAAIVIPAFMSGTWPNWKVAVPLFLLAGLLWLVFYIVVGAIKAVLLPVMYSRRCTVKEAWPDVRAALEARPLPIFLQLLVRFAAGIAASIAMVIAACITCCLGALPYVSTVILLPLHVFVVGFMLLFARQFGPDYDAWRGQPPANDAPPPLPSP